MEARSASPGTFAVVNLGPTSSSPNIDPLIGVLVERRYRIESLIARGGMSAVYVGYDERLHRPVAVKVMNAAYRDDPVFLSRFEFEARAVAGLKHPGLVAVYDQGIDEHAVFLVMELVKGGSLRELLRERGPMPPHAVAAVLKPVLGGLGTAHVAGLVHRDVKPENVLISEDGDVKIADFGLVRAVAESGLTSNSVILGTAAYLSPEQIESTRADARSDVYSTGIVMFELLTGRTPFHGDTPIGLAYARLTYDVPAPGDVVDGVPPQFDEITLRATERDPVHRYADGFEMALALMQAIEELSLPQFTVPSPQRAKTRVTDNYVRDKHASVMRPDLNRNTSGTAVLASEDDHQSDYENNVNVSPRFLDSYYRKRYSDKAGYQLDNDDEDDATGPVTCDTKIFPTMFWLTIYGLLISGIAAVGWVIGLHILS